MAIKISDLSVGDWVILPTWGDYPMRVYAFYDGGKIGVHTSDRRDGIECFASDLEPIPITAEILEKIGFERSTSQFIVYHTDKVWISYEKPSETWSVTMYINDVTSNLHANINYIHQLQHALRLAGVDKEINL